MANGRDRRDPKALGQAIIDMAAERGISATQAVHALNGAQFPDYDPGESTVVETARAYRMELKARAAEGDKFAISMLMTGQPGDSDA